MPSEDAHETTDVPEEAGSAEPAAPVTRPETAGEVEALRQRTSELEDALKRERADFVNYRRRSEARTDELAAATRAQLLAGMTALFDAFHDTAQGIERHQDFEGLRDAFKALLTEFDRLLDAWGIQRIGQPGEEFDANRHEVVYTRPSPDTERPRIAQVVRPGYALAGRVLRAAKVVVEQPQESRPEGETTDANV